MRAEKGDRFLVDGHDVVEGVLRVRQDMLRFVDQVHEFHATGAITDVVNIGIGGSDLGGDGRKSPAATRHRSSLSFH